MVNLRSVLGKLDFSLSKEEQKHLDDECAVFMELLKAGIKKQGVTAEAFIGGSYAKGTLVKKRDYDIDIFVRFDWKHEAISDELDKILGGAKKKFKVERVHGSRDYFRATRDRKIYFEIVPTVAISKPKEMRNVTDLSYFHVNYVKKKLKNERLRGDVKLAKTFFKAQRVYGAESYINGFSGYALECLVIAYGSFEKMLKALVKVKPGERVILDPEKQYKKKDEILLDMNENKLASPIILVDPTWKERNVLAALNRETFEKFQEAARAFLGKPSEAFFYEKEISEEQLKKEATGKKAELIVVKLKTDKQEGDIAGSKMKKFAALFEFELSPGFKILKREFDYSGGREAKVYLIVRSHGEIIKKGPPVKLKEHAAAFRKEHSRVVSKGGNLYAKIKIDISAKAFASKLLNTLERKMKEMSIISMDID